MDHDEAVEVIGDVLDRTLGRTRRAEAILDALGFDFLNHCRRLAYPPTQPMYADPALPIGHNDRK